MGNYENVETVGITIIDLIAIPYVEMFHIFMDEDIVSMEAYIYFRHILRHPSYKNAKLFKSSEHQPITKLVEGITDNQFTLSVRISKFDFMNVLEECRHLSHIRKMWFDTFKSELFRIFQEYMINTSNPRIGSDENHISINGSLPFNINTDVAKFFRFNAMDVENNKYCFDAIMCTMENIVGGGDMVIEFLIQKIVMS